MAKKRERPEQPRARKKPLSVVEQLYGEEVVPDVQIIQSLKTQKRQCMLTRRDFCDMARSIIVSIEGLKDDIVIPVHKQPDGTPGFKPNAKRGTKGSLGWYINTRIPVKIGTEYHLGQLTMQIVLIGSNELPDS